MAYDSFLHLIKEGNAPKQGSAVQLQVNTDRRAAIQRHHTVTHIFHWALREIVGPDASQKGSYVGPEKFTIDFNSQALTPCQLADIEKLVNQRTVEICAVCWT